MRKIKSCVNLLRITHYVKNTLIIFPLFFSKNINIKNITITIIGCLIFSFVSSIVYILNDINDIEKDKQHPVKCKRPLASGALSIKEAYCIVFFLTIIIISILFIFNIKSLSTHIILLYLIINIIYSKYAKNVPIIDVLILAFGYLLRIFLGASLINVTVSNWLYLTILFGALFMGIGKRLGEIRYISKESRKVLEFYNEQFLYQNMYMSLTITIVFYALWCVSQEVTALYPEMIWTTILIYAICMNL